MASAWGDSWGTSWGDSWGATVVVPPVVVEEPPPRAMYSGGGYSYRPRDKDVEDLMRLPDPPRRKGKRKKKKPEPTPEEIEDAAIELMQLAGFGPTPSVVRAVLGDGAEAILEMRRRHEADAAIRLAVEAMLNAAADAAQEALIEADEEDVMLLLAAA